MTKILSISDHGVSTGFGRIASKVDMALVKRGYSVQSMSFAYDGQLPPLYDGEPLPFWVSPLNMSAVPLAGAQWTDRVLNMINVQNPDVVWVTQDAPYAVAVRNLPVDWSKRALVVTTPVDGVPIFPEWVEMMKQVDGALTISAFGVKAYADAGVQVGLCRPGIEPNKFFHLPDEKRAELRAKMGFAPDAFIHGVFCQHQGRKAVPATIRAFVDFAKDKPNARLYLDMDEISPAGWHLPAMFEQYHWDSSKIVFRSEAIKRGIFDLNERYNLLDSHSVIAFREGFGLPVLESMATGAVSMAQDYCAGTEVLEDGRGILIPPIQLEGEDYQHISTWGNAADKLPNYREMTRKLQWLYDNPDERRAMAKRGMEWARQQTWDRAVDTACDVLEKALARKKTKAVLAVPTITPVVPAAPVVQTSIVSPSVDGLRDVALVEQKA